MEDQKASYQTFEDLDAYKIAREFRRALYGVATRLPESEKFGLASQVRRAAVSLTNNIAEGHGRFHYLDLKEHGWRVHKVLNGYIRFLRNRKPECSSRVAENVLEYSALNDESGDRFNASTL